MGQIVIIDASIVEAPQPKTLQETGALISQGATTLTPGSYSLLTQKGNITPLLAPPLALTSLLWSGGVVVATTAAAIPGLNTGDTFITTIAGVTPAAYNGTYNVTVTGANTFTYALANDPTTETAPGTFTPPGQGELAAMVNTFFAQGPGQSVSVLELGPANGTTGPALLGAWIAVNPDQFYSYLAPRLWDATAAYNALISQFESPNSKTYFFTTTTPSTYGAYLGVMKNVLAEVEAPNLALTEFTLAADFQHTLNYNPSSVNRMTPNSFAPLFGVTPYPSAGGNQPLLDTLKAANINYVGTGAEGGVSNTILFWGKVLDGNDFGWWYAADWIQINLDLNIANAVIEGSQNKANPLVYDQNGINRLQVVGFNTFSTAISFGLLTGGVVQTELDPVTFATNLDDGLYAGLNVINMIPFATYTKLNPNDYAIGKYAGFTGVAIPQNGFQQIVFSLLVTNLIGSL